MACLDNRKVVDDWDKWTDDKYTAFCNRRCNRCSCKQRLCQRLVRELLMIFCLCYVDSPKRSWTTLHHTVMAFCSFNLAILAIISFAPFALMTGSDFCVLFSHKELNTDSQSCKFVLGGEVSKCLCALALVVWFWVKARFGFGAKLDSVWLNLIQLLFLVLVLMIAFSSAVIITIGLNHASNRPRLSDRYDSDSVQNAGHHNFSDSSFSISDEKPGQHNSNDLVFDTDLNFSDFNISNEEPAHMIRSVAEISAWIGVSGFVLMFAATIASFVGYLCKKEPLPTNM